MFPTLEQLAEQEGPVDVKKYGLKTEGLVELIRAIPFFANLENEFCRFDYEVPAGFVVPYSETFNIEELRESYFELVKDEKELSAVMARSSHEDEQPGKFETIAVTYDPSKPEESFEKFLEAFQKVRNDPLKPVIVQKMVGDMNLVNLDNEVSTLIKFPLYDRDLDYEDIMQQVMAQVPEDWNNFTIEVKAGKNAWGSWFDMKDEMSYRRNKTHGEALKKAIDRIKENLEYGKIRFGQRNKKFKKNRAYIEITAYGVPNIPLIGAHSTGFVFRSHSHMDAGISIANYCIGLSTKLVNNPDQILILKWDDEMLFYTPFCTGNSYSSSCQNYIQNKKDVFDLRKGEVVSIYSEGETMIDGTHNIDVPKGVYFSREGLMGLVKHFSEKLEVPVEIEGCVSNSINRFDQKIFIYQLTKSHLLENEIDRLSEVPEEEKIFEVEESVLGSIKFSGDVVYYWGDEDDPRLNELLEEYDGKVLFMASEFKDKLIERHGIEYYVNTGTESSTLYRIGAENRANRSTHFYGYLTSEIHRRMREGHKVCCETRELDFDALAEENIGKFEDRRTVDKENRIVVLRDVTVEATKGKMQIYFN